MTKTTIGILETGVPPAALVPEHGRYDAMVRRLLGDDFTARTYDVQAGELPAGPDSHAALVITGSSTGVYDPLPWIAPLKSFIREAHGRAKLVGLCFGHQIMAEALGGRVEKSAKGWGLGLHDYDVVSAAPWMGESPPPTIAVAASHQDQVVDPPPGATVLLASPFTPFAGLHYEGGTALSVQFHPEFTHAFAAELLRFRKAALPDGMAERAIASLERPGDAVRVGAWIRRFLAEGI
jgi:GMP synthase-like glutamine amidotransferase